MRNRAERALEEEGALSSMSASSTPRKSEGDGLMNNFLSQDEEDDHTCEWLSRATGLASLLLLLVSATGLIFGSEEDPEELPAFETDDGDAAGYFSNFLGSVHRSPGSMAACGTLLILLIGEGLQRLTRWITTRYAVFSGSYCIVLDRQDASAKLGLDVDHLGAEFPVGRSGRERWTLLPVLSLSEGGLAEQWNSSAQRVGRRKVCPGDHIVEVNRVWGDAAAMVERCRVDPVLEMRLTRSAPSSHLLSSLRRMKRAEQARQRLGAAARHSPASTASALDDKRYPWLAQTKRQGKAAFAPKAQPPLPETPLRKLLSTLLRKAKLA
eukprot:TRINITY_DN33277_c0_g1_i1.p1 TRINITY_DN33277_c0_g1~~TRINITY_DN33277_c0_g1_i1.p1  ORF type:complete len:325 (+),score=57.77 TRINITY_DN33277_c0_g1_i1:40-1014(+)